MHESRWLRRLRLPQESSRKTRMRACFINCFCLPRAKVNFRLISNVGRKSERWSLNRLPSAFPCTVHITRSRAWRGF